jgi:hypothetical protein
MIATVGVVFDLPSLKPMLKRTWSSAAEAFFDKSELKYELNRGHETLRQARSVSGCQDLKRDGYAGCHFPSIASGIGDRRESGISGLFLTPAGVYPAPGAGLK